MREGQRAVEFGIYQGESREGAENLKLGQVTVPVPARRAGMAQVLVRFSYDASGLLEVDVTVPETGETRQLVIADDEEREDAAAFEKRRAELARLKFHPRDADANRAVLERAKRCYEGRIGDTRAYVASLISRFQDALDSQDPRAVETVREETARALDEMEGERFL